MTSNLSEEEGQIIEQWLDDPTFINWAEQTDKESIASWEEYFNLNPKQWHLAKIGKSLISGIPFIDVDINKADGEIALSSLLKGLKKNSINASKVSKSRIIRLRRPWRIAASIAMLALISGIACFQFIYNPEILLSTEFGQHMESRLPDGSLITLNANSSIRYQRQNPRLVRLEGEAYFEVAKKPDTEEEFQVITQDLLVIVMGTSFNVNTRNDQTEVMLKEGKVILDVTGSSKEVIEMEPGDLITYSRKNNELKENLGDISVLETAAWKEGSLLFKNTPLTNALFEIEDIYGIQFVIQTDALKKQTISGGVPIRDLNITLSTLKEVYGIQMEVTGKRYFISGRD